MSKRTDPPGAASPGLGSRGFGSLATGALTGGSLLVVSAVAALVGVVIAREFGRGAETDGLLAAYGVFLVIAIGAQATRVALLAELARAQRQNRLAGEIAGFAIALAVVAAPLILAAELAAKPIAELLTGDASTLARDSAADSLRWMVPAGVAQLYAALAASGLAAVDDYLTAALGYAAGSFAGLTLILSRADTDGIIAVAWGMTLNGAISVLVPAAGLAVHALRKDMPRHAVRPSGPPIRARLGVFAVGAALPLALQVVYVVCLPFAGRQGTGEATSFVYAYLAAASLVTVTAGSLGLVTSVPLTRSELTPRRAARHVVATSWLALALVGGAAGAFALAGGDLVEAALGDAYGGDVGSEVGRLVVILCLWIVASIGVAVTFPLAFVTDRTRGLPIIAVGVIALQVPLAWAAAELIGLEGLALALAASTFVVLGALLVELRALLAAAWGLLRAAGIVAAAAVLAFGLPALVLGPIASAAVGLLLYGGVLSLVRQRGLSDSWHYLRALS